jgi:hypothetical protein
MRQPTRLSEAYAWHSSAMAGEHPPVTHDPQCGWFRRKLVKGGPWVPARIWLEQEIDPETGELVRDETMMAEVNGEPADPDDAWTWLCSEPISEEQFNYMEAAAAHARLHAPLSPEARPRQRILVRALPRLF